MKILATMPKDLDLDRMSDRIDRVVSIGLEQPYQTLGEGSGAGLATHLLPDLDHALARLREPTSR